MEEHRPQDLRRRLRRKLAGLRALHRGAWLLARTFGRGWRQRVAIYLSCIYLALVLKRRGCF